MFWHLCVCARKIKFKWEDQVQVKLCLTGQTHMSRGKLIYDYYLFPQLHVINLISSVCLTSWPILLQLHLCYVAVLGWKINCSPFFRNCHFSWPSCVFSWCFLLCPKGHSCNPPVSNIWASFFKCLCSGLVLWNQLPSFNRVEQYGVVKLSVTLCRICKWYQKHKNLS